MKLANLSMSSGKFPDLYKIAEVRPLLKKPNLDPANPANYRPISNLHTISKLLERLVQSRLRPHLLTSANFNRFQSAYRQGYSTESVVLKNMDDSLNQINDRKVTLLVSLDISAAFDTICHTKLLDRLDKEFGVRGIVLEWIESYLTDRSQFVKMGKWCANATTCLSGVPQGSVLGPLLFITYVSPIAEVVAHHGLRFHQYADDTQLYISAKPGDLEAGVPSSVVECTNAVRAWFLQNGMLLNPDKSEVILFGTRQQLQRCGNVNTADIAGSPLPVLPSVKILGVTLDKKLSLRAHVSNLYRTCNYHLSGLRHIRRYLSVETANAMAVSIVGSHLDYCNSILNNTFAENLNKLQRLQNNLARVVLQQPRRAPGAPLLRQLHWLPVRFRIQYKTAVITHKAIYSRAPSYLSELLTETLQTHRTRSAEQKHLYQPVPNSNIASRGFRYVAPSVWNTLPAVIRTDASPDSFKSKLKTHYFSLAFTD